MPGFVLNAWHVGTLMSLAGVGAPVVGSPLRSLAIFPRPIAPGEPDWEYLVDNRLVVENGKGWRVNGVMAGVLRACAEPDEVVNVGVGDIENPGFSVVRRGELVCECTITTGGTTKLYFPLTRSEVLLSLIGALSGDESDHPKPSGFRFRGSAEDAFVLGAALRELRADNFPITVPELKKAVARYATEPKLRAGFAFIGQTDAVEALASSTRRSDAAIKRLVAAGHLKIVREKVKVSAAAEAALTHWPTGIFGVSHVEFDKSGPVSRTMQAMRVGPRTLVFRPVARPGHPPEFEWAEVSRRELRALVAGMLLRDEELEAFVSGKKLPAGAAKKAAAARKAPAPRPRREPAATTAAAPVAAPAPVAAAMWVPTHTVPPEGMPAWAKPDGNQAAVANLGGSLPVQVTEELGAWAHVVCSNGWKGWVDGRRLTRA